MTNIPAYPASRGPAMAAKVRQRQEQTVYAAALLENELRKLEDLTVEKFVVEDKRAAAVARMHDLAEKNRSRRGRR
jgi:hypothetical protein